MSLEYIQLCGICRVDGMFTIETGRHCNHLFDCKFKIHAANTELDDPGLQNIVGVGIIQIGMNASTLDGMKSTTIPKCTVLLFTHVVEECWPGHWKL